MRQKKAQAATAAVIATPLRLRKRRAEDRQDCSTVSGSSTPARTTRLRGDVSQGFPPATENTSLPLSPRVMRRCQSLNQSGTIERTPQNSRCASRGRNTLNPSDGPRNDNGPTLRSHGLASERSRKPSNHNRRRLQHPSPDARPETSAKARTQPSNPTPSTRASTSRKRVSKLNGAEASCGMLLRAAAKKLPLPCKYAPSGCTEYVILVDMDKHAMVCDHRPYHCPLSSNNCHWKGELCEVVGHLLKSHPDVSQLRGPMSHITLNNVRQVPPAEWMSIQTCLGQNFLVCVQKSIRDGHPQFFGTVQIIGSKEEADRFEYKISLNKPDSSRRVSYSTTVRNIRNASQAVIDKDCLVFDGTYLELFCANDSLVIEVNISVMRV